jgi:hypothetical protein
VRRLYPIERVLRAAAARALRTLRRRLLDNQQIRELLNRLREEADFHAMTAAWPTVGEERKTLESAQGQALALANSLAGLSPRTTQYLTMHMVSAACGVEPASAMELAQTLRALTSACDQVLAAMPAQSKRSSRVGIVAHVAAVVPSIPVTDSKGHFHDICSAAFLLAGETEDPERALRRERDRELMGKDPTPAIRRYLKLTKQPTRQ